MIGECVGSYRIVSQLGKGGMGVVYRAEHLQLGRAAAVKMLLPRLSSDASIVQRFFNEARAASAIEHAGIVEIFDVGTHSDGRAYIVMELLRGESLQHRLERGGVSALEAANIVAQACGALAAAHAKGIIHRDLKPDNLFLVPNELVPGGIQIKLLDFGIAKLTDEHSDVRTQTGAVIGTPAYMSPEQCMGRSDVDHRTDLFALGCILFHLVCGRPPFLSAHGSGDVIAAHIRDPAPHPRSFNPAVTDALADVMLRLLEKDPEKRFASAAELRTALIAAGATAPATRASAAADLAMAATIAPGATTASGTATTASSLGELVPSLAPSKSAPRADRRLVGALAVVAAGAIGALIVVALRGGGERRSGAAGEIVASNAVDAAVAATAAPVAPVDAAIVASPTLVIDAGVSANPVVTAARPSRPTFTIAGGTYRPDANVVVRFSRPISSKRGVNEAWIAIVEAGKPPSEYGTWTWLKDGATAITLKAPVKPGSYQVRLHTDYPRLNNNLRYARPLDVAAP